jgi:hypothetical protein
MHVGMRVDLAGSVMVPVRVDQIGAFQQVAIAEDLLRSPFGDQTA